MTPDKFADLLIFEKPVVASLHLGTVTLPSCVLLGPVVRPIVLSSSGEIGCAGIRLPLWSLGVLATKSSRDRPWVDAAPLLGTTLDQVRTALRARRESDVLEGLVAILDVLFASLAPDQVLLSKLFWEHGGTPTSRQAAKTLKIGIRSAQRRLKAMTLLSARQLGTIERFQRVRDILWERPQVALAELALSAGYADQSHMTREFRRYSGMTPRAFAHSFGER